jgi:protein-tyrosine phosphatase
MNTVLVVCVGNICRSPIAEALLRCALPEMRVFSAGLEAVVGSHPDPDATRLMLELGIDISFHRGQQLTGWMLNAADLVLVMEAEHRRIVETMYPRCKGKVFRLCEFDGQDVTDPYGRGEAAMRHALRLITEAVSQWSERLSRLTNKFASRRAG